MTDPVTTPPVVDNEDPTKDPEFAKFLETLPEKKQPVVQDVQPPAEAPAASADEALPDLSFHYDPETEKRIRGQFKQETANALLSGDQKLQQDTIAKIGLDDPYMASWARTHLDLDHTGTYNKSLTSKVVSGAKAVEGAAHDTVMHAPENIVLGAADALDNSVKFGTMIGNLAVPEDAQVDTKNVSVFGQSHEEKSFVRDATAFTVGFLGAGKLLGGSKLLAASPIIKSALAAGIGSTVTMDATPESRLSDLLESYPHLSNPITDFLAANVYDKDGKVIDSKHESEAMGRLRNGLENTLAGPVVDKLLGIVGGVAKWAVGKVKPGTPQAAAIEKEIAEKIQAADDSAAIPPEAPVVEPQAAPKAPKAASPQPAAPQAVDPRSTSPYSLPDDLTRIKPRYGYKNSNFILQFTDDFDKATYTLANPKTKSARHDDILQSLIDQTGMSEADLIAHGSKVRAEIKSMAAAADAGGAGTVHDILGVPRMRAADVPPVAPKAAASGTGKPPKPPTGTTPGAASPAPEPTPPVGPVIPKDSADRILAAAQNGVSPEDSLRHVNINVPKVTDSVTAANILHQTSLELPEGALATPGWNLEQNAKEAASLLGVGQTEFMTGLGKLAGSADNIPKYLVASRMVIAQKAGELSQLSTKIIGPGASPEAIAAWRSKLQELEAIRGPFSEVQAGGARGVTSGNTKVTPAVLKDGTVVGQAVDAQGKPIGQTKPTAEPAKPIDVNQSNVNEAGRAAGLSPEEAEKAAKMAAIGDGDWKATAKVASAFNKSLSVFNEVYINAILSGPKTFFANLSGAVTIVGQPIEKMLGGAMMAAAGKQGGKDAFLEGMQHLASLHSATWDVISAMKKGFDSPVLRTLKSESGVLDKGHGTVDVGHAITAANLLPEGLQGTTIGSTVDWAGKLIRIPTRLMTTSDELMKQINYRAFVSARGTREGIVKGFKGKDLDNFVQDYVGKAYDETGAGTHAAALANSQKATFTNPLLPDTLGNGLSSLASKHPIVRTLIPFIRTPTNIIRGVGQRTLLTAPLYKEFRQDIAAGGFRASEALGKLAMGTTFYTAAITLAANDMITGGGPADPTLKKQKMATGWQPYSVKSGDKYYAFNRLDPVGMFFGLAADFHEVSGQVEDSAALDTAGHMTLALMRNLSSKTYLQGLTSALDAISKPETAGKRFVQGIASGAVPYSGLTKSINKQENPYFADVRTLMDSVRSSIPGYGASLPPRRDIVGDKIAVPSGLGPDMLSPAATSVDVHDSVRTELARLNHAFEIPNSKVGNVDLRDFPNKEGQSAYDRYQELVGQVTRNGAPIKEGLKNLIESPKYKELGTDNMPAVGQGSRVSDIQVLLQKYREKALKQTIEEYPEVKKQLGQDKTNKRDLKHNRVDQIINLNK